MKQVEGKAFAGFHDCLVEHMTQIRNLLLGQPPIFAFVNIPEPWHGLAGSRARLCCKHSLHLNRFKCV